MTLVASESIERVNDYLEKVVALSLGTDPDDFFAFRGQSQNWPFLPSIARKPYTEKGIYTTPGQLPKPAEYRLFMRFRDTTIPYQPAWLHVPSPTDHAWRQLILAQHDRLPR